PDSSRRLQEGDRVEFSIEYGLKGPAAAEIMRLGRPAEGDEPAPRAPRPVRTAERKPERDRSTAPRRSAERPARRPYEPPRPGVIQPAGDRPGPLLLGRSSDPQHRSIPAYEGRRQTAPFERPERRRPRPVEPRDEPEAAAPEAIQPPVERLVRSVAPRDVPDGGVSFAELGLIEPLLRAVETEGYTHPTPIQAQAIPGVLEGRDLLGCAQTGTGKTASFALPILQMLAQDGPLPERSTPRVIRALVLAPTRELALQISESFSVYGRNLPFRHAVVFGGVGQGPQVTALKRGVDVLVATPGRLLDLMGQGYIKLNNVRYLVLDEADRMLDMGFIHDVQRIVRAVPNDRQTLFFSATLPDDILILAKNILDDPVRVSVTPEQPTVERIEQVLYFVDKKQKQDLLEHLLLDPALDRALVFTRTKHGANRVVKHLEQAGIRAEPIHGNKSQGARQQALSNFKTGRTRVLVATDVAARGLDVDDISHVIQFDLPNEPETYVHRIGRTGRAGAAGIAISFCDAEEHAFLRDIQKLIKMQIPVIVEHPYAMSAQLVQRAAALSKKPLPFNGGARSGRSFPRARSGVR
ncbi:MAG: DEAD/DEAH box helicase, partial [Anaerolineae bacterium]|nr:DEAD/DEAH box helicase [Anaerolineae bacterium]